MSEAFKIGRESGGGRSSTAQNAAAQVPNRNKYTLPLLHHDRRRRQSHTTEHFQANTTNTMEAAMRAVDTIKSFRVRMGTSGLWDFRLIFFLGNDLQEARLSTLRPPSEFFDPNRLSRPTDLNQTVSARRFCLF
jgi:hypothetical protein